METVMQRHKNRLLPFQNKASRSKQQKSFRAYPTHRAPPCLFRHARLAAQRPDRRATPCC
eukprot:5146047-Pleurochrysis_carterae.AAC.1